MEYYGMDVHKRYSVFTCMDDKGQVVRRGRVANNKEELCQVVAPSGGAAKVVLEATSNWGYIFDVLEPWVEEVVMAHPSRVKAISSAKVKTDRIDADILAHLLRADLIPAAYAAPPQVRDQREWLRSRTSVVRMAAQLKNRIHAVLARSGVNAPVSDVFGKGGRAWLGQVDLRSMRRDIVERYLCLLDALGEDIRETTAQVRRQAQDDPRARLLMTIPGIGPLTSLMFLAEVGDVHRFPDARHLVSYAGLAPRVRASGGKVHLGHISKQGSPWLRWVFTEAAVTAGRIGCLGEFYRRVQRRAGRQAAIIATARKLLVIAYHVAKKGQPYREGTG